MPQIVSFFQEKFTLFPIYIELMFTQLFKDNSKMLFMLFFRLGKDKNVIKECTKKMSKWSAISGLGAPYLTGAYIWRHPSSVVLTTLTFSSDSWSPIFVASSLAEYN